MDDFDFLRIIQLITRRTGIIPRDSHKTGIKNFIEKRLPQIKEPVPSYYNYITEHPEELTLLINSATVNETYFFREEIQFKLLQEKIFPEIAARKGQPIKIWSAASSSGEEIYSLYLLANAMGLNTELTATDINTDMLEICTEGKYKKKALRSVDGAAFKELLQPYKTEDDMFCIPDEIRSKINRKQINLANMQEIPKNQDVIFIRNVFIYFGTETRKNILERFATQALAPGGYLFVSMNETASIEKSMIPPELEKCADGKVFYFRRKEG